MKILAALSITALLLVGCASVNPSKVSLERKLPNDYCTVSWDNNGNSAMNCVQFMSKEEMEQYILLTRKDCTEVEEVPDPHAPKYESDK